VLLLARSAITDNEVLVQTHLTEEALSVQGDRVQVQQVILNLILNAVEAMGSSKAGARELLISTEQECKGVLVAVRDSGPGIDPAHLERVFDAFYTTKPSGVGMGLAICRSIIENHGGRLWPLLVGHTGLSFSLRSLLSRLDQRMVAFWPLTDIQDHSSDVCLPGVKRTSSGRFGEISD
jgi:signal transduction histidine kinase